MAPEKPESPAHIRKALSTKRNVGKEPNKYNQGYVAPKKTSKFMRKAGTKASGGGQDRNVTKSPATIKDAAYEKSNRKMRSKYTKETGKTLGKRHLTGTSPRRVSFACRFAGMAGAMKDKKGEPTRKAMALKKWGFGSVGAASSFCQKNKKS